MEFIEAPLFSELLPEYLSDDDYRGLQLRLADDPEAGAVIPGTGGFRKVRWADRRYYLVDHASIWFMTLYDKDEAADLTAAEKRLLKAAIQEETRQRAFRPRSRRK